jgi:hypothetical protein
MASYQLVVNGGSDLGEVEPAALLGHAGVKHHLEQQIAELIAQVLSVATLDGVGDLVGLLDGVRRDAGEALLPVPGAPLLRVAQARHQLEQRPE